MKFAIATLGCKVNQYESQLIREALTGGGFSEQDFSCPGADLYIVNTCTVTHRSDAEDRKLIRKALGFGGRLIVTGCQVKAYPEGIEGMSGRMEMVPFEDMGPALGIPMPSHITDFLDHSRAFVNVQQGCDNHCTFCIVPQARGFPRSRPLGEILTETSCLYESGFREVILTGINIGLYEGGVPALLEKILVNTSMPRLRISSIEPWTLTDDIIGLVVSEPRVCKHLHLPLQSGSDEILRKMGRPYLSGHYQGLVEKIRYLSRDIAIGADIMVGFPGEGEEQFKETYSLISDLDIAYLHVFPYSKRPGTPAASYDGQVDPRTVKQRASALRELSHVKKMKFIGSQEGKDAEVLVTHVEGDDFRGITSNYLKVHGTGKAKVNDLMMTVLDEAHDSHLVGRPRG